MKPVISIGNQDFKDLRETQAFYVDKTDFIREWWENNDPVTLITRPRRFGKTLNLSMMEYFFSIQYAGSGQLFEGLSIWNDEKYHKLQGSFPVIFLSFADIKATTFESAKRSIFQKLVKLFSIHSYVKTDSILHAEDWEYLSHVNMQMTEDTAVLSVNYLSDYLFRYYGKPALIFLDEYDTPMQEAYVNGYWEELTALVRSLFQATFKSNKYLKRALLTGITRIGKESIFSDLNNIQVITTTSNKYETAFGFTEDEVFQALEITGLAEQKENVQKWYDGFCFGNKTDIYNPWSITNFLDSGEFGTYWADTSSNKLVSDLIRKGTPQLKMQMEDLLEGGTLDAELDEQVVFDQLGQIPGAVWGLLLASGYLKAVNKSFNMDTGCWKYKLQITNQETVLMFRRMIASWFPADLTSYNDFIKALLAGDLEYMNQFMNEVATEVFGSFDTGTKPSQKSRPERFYHGFVLGLIVELRTQYRIRSNRQSGWGRYDVLMEPKNSTDPAIIMEFKVYDPKKENNLEETVSNALGQIRRMKYDTELTSRGIENKRIRHYGFGFRGQEVLIGEEVI